MQKITATYKPAQPVTGQLYLTARKVQQTARQMAHSLNMATRMRLVQHLKFKRAQARKSGYKNGFQQGLQAAEQFTADLKQHLASERIQLERDLTKLSFKITELFIKREMRSNKTLLSRILTEHLQQNVHNNLIRVRVPTEQIDWFQELALDVVADDTLTPGNFRFEVNSGSLRTDWESQLKKIEQSLLMQWEDSHIAS